MASRATEIRLVLAAFALLAVVFVGWPEIDLWASRQFYADGLWAMRGGQPVLRENVVTDNGNLIIDVYNLRILEPAVLEAELNNIAGIVAVGLFALRPADVLLLGTADSVQTIRFAGR